MLKSRKYLFVRVKKNGVKRYVLACASANFSKKMTPTQKTQKCSGGGYLLFSSRSELRSNRAYSSVGASTFTPRGGSMLTPRSELRHLLLEGTSVLTPPSELRHLLLEGTSVLTPPSELQCLFLRRCFGIYFSRELRCLLLRRSFNAYSSVGASAGASAGAS